MTSVPVRPEDYRALLTEHGPGPVAGVRLLASADLAAEQSRHSPPHPDALLWGVFDTGETCWWLPIHPDPVSWLVVVAGHGVQQLNLSTTEFLRRLGAGQLDLPVLSGLPGPRDPLAQLRTLIGPGGGHRYDWAALERELGCPLPPDYRLLFEEYGSQPVLNGLFPSPPEELVSVHRDHAHFLDDLDGYRVHPAPGGLLTCLISEGRQQLCWDTSGLDPAAWPLVDSDTGEVFPGTLTELLVAELVGRGPGLCAHGLGDPDTWAYPMWGPDPVH
ncbi:MULTISPECIES: SMI1/KNR4 family protein [unclassified Crossiella]|uniref:SMI1/KNR4 family protein n=1 Tax=unclassified Crossiella TaxID=2620835 RepID=UPI0020005509|nr:MULTISPECIES: SMI1/KNR4 family protein [unclassified Crossiella]MCK2244756.1 SMI1/KNR4 family protein [Crossiella sp. S99.2]MCK2258246.1 SMI1/KNR4 family protein [Crossiella sp. S99.1]